MADCYDKLKKRPSPLFKLCHVLFSQQPLLYLYLIVPIHIFASSGNRSWYETSGSDTLAPRIPLDPVGIAEPLGCVCMAIMLSVRDENLKLQTYMLSKKISWNREF